MKAPDHLIRATVISDIMAERRRQVEAEGWTVEHDDEHADGSLALVAALYATPIPLFEIRRGDNGVTWTDPWPWRKRITYHRYGDGDPVFTVPVGDKREKHGRRKALVVAAALVIAEIERLDRGASVDRSPEGGNHEDGCHAKHESAVAASETPNLSPQGHSHD